MRYILAVVLALSGAALGAFGQGLPISTIESVGTATVEAPPDYVDFWLHKEVAAATFVEAVTAVGQFGPALRKELATRELSPAELSVTAPSIPGAGGPGARVSARLRFSMSPFGNLETGPQLFATLCDKMMGVAETLDSLIEGPLLAVQDPAIVEQTAVSVATENALPLAQAVAELMSAHITAVDHVAVEEPSWNASPDTKAALPDVRRVTCTARVRVIYAFSGTGE